MTRVKRSPELADLICSAIAQGKSLRGLIEAKVAPCSIRFVSDWLTQDGDFALQYHRAREQQAEYFADEIIDIADRSTPETAHVARLQVDARKWATSKILPKKYGDRAGDIQVNTTINQVVLTEERRQELIQRRQAQLNG